MGSLPKTWRGSCPQVYPNSNTVVVSTENITQNWYFGNDRAMLIPNCLFRVGGAALVLSNRRGARMRAKYELAHVVRTHVGADDASYGCVFQREDDEGKTGAYPRHSCLGQASFYAPRCILQRLGISI